MPRLPPSSTVEQDLAPHPPTDRLTVLQKHGEARIFRSTEDLSFARRLRSLSSRQKVDPGWKSPYELGNMRLGEGGGIRALLESSLYPAVRFVVRLDILKDCESFRLRIDELESATGLSRYAGVAQVVIGDPELAEGDTLSIDLTQDPKSTTIHLGAGYSVQIDHAPLKITVRKDGVVVMVFNQRGLLHLEHFRTKEEEEGTEVGRDLGGEGFDDDEVERQAGIKNFLGPRDSSAFKEVFERFTQFNARGPEGYSFDVSFPQSKDLYGLGGHATGQNLSLPCTDGSTYSEPYRIFNIDHFHYPPSSPHASYGSVPFVQAHSKAGTVGVLCMMGSDGFVDVTRAEDQTIQTHWFAESGVLDMVVLLGPTPKDVSRQYAALTGPTPIPPLFALGYHQCRWNYHSREDVMGVNQGFKAADIPVDVMWLDIDWAEGRKYFEWAEEFPDPKGMIGELVEGGRKVVVVVDPHLAATAEYSLYREAKDQGFLVKDSVGKVFQGLCWPEESVWVDFTKPGAIEWWAGLYGLEKFKESTEDVYIWNDMNEPAIFQSLEKTLPKEALHDGNVEHRHVHNTYGMLMQQGTFDGLMKRSEGRKRPFVLARSYFAGSQKYGAVWTGDNTASWEHLASETAMLLNLGICGISFAGADVGGFFGNPDRELLIRWYQAGAFYPFFRAHSQKNTKRREPYLFPAWVRDNIRTAIRLRYRMLPVWYTAFQVGSVTGLPVMRSMHTENPQDEDGFRVGDQYFVGDSGILFKPVVVQTDSTSVYLPPRKVFYDFYTHETFPATVTGRYVAISTPISHSAILIQGGSILPLHDRIGSSTVGALQRDVTLIVAPDEKGRAEGQLCLDDGDSFAYREGKFILVSFVYEGGVLRCSTNPEGGWETVAKVVKVEVLGAGDPDGGDGGPAPRSVVRSDLSYGVATEWSLSMVY